MKELTTLYADFMQDISYDKLPAEVVSQTKQRILDFMGVALGGYHLMKFPKAVIDCMTRLGGSPEATIVQAKQQKFPAINAAFANASCGHALDMDDGHRFAALHPGTVVIPAAIAAAEISETDTRELIAGIIAGYEIMIRIGMSINPSHLLRGFHPTGVVGPFGAAAAAGKIMKLSHEEMVGALGLAGIQGAGLVEIIHDDKAAEVKPLHPANAARSGLLSAILAQKGARGPVTILEGSNGFLKAVADEVNKAPLTENLGQKYEISNAYTKFYAACRHTHASVDAALAILNSSHIDPQEISSISIETYYVALHGCSAMHPSTPSAARFSIPFAVALALVKGDASAQRFSAENVKDESIQSLAGKVRLSVSSKWEKLFPSKRGATVSIKDVRGKEISAEVDLAKGEPENPASWDDIYNKYYTNATLLISEEAAKKLGETTMDLENVSLDEFVRLI